MSDVKLYFFPGTCAQVTAVALEETAIAYELALADMRTPEGRATFAKVSPKAKVPALLFGDRLLVENPAILWFLDQRTPGKLFPPFNDAFEQQARLGDLAWCASDLHPMVRQVRMPQLWTTGNPAGVAEDGMTKLRQQAATIELRVSADRWWYGDRWSIVDQYLWWCFRNAQRGGMSLEDFPALLNYLDRIDARPSTTAVLAKQAALGITPIATTHRREDAWQSGSSDKEN